jgi:AcrR family transcriptional regulator
MERKVRNKKPKTPKETNNTIHRQTEIYQKALDLFVKKGYDATSMSMIAKALKMSKPNLYYYCPSKEELLYQIHLDDLQKLFVPILDEAEKIQDPKDRIAHFLRRFTLMCTASPASRVLVHELRSLSKRHHEQISAVWRRAYEIFRGAIKELQQSGRGREGRESFLTFLGTGMALWIVYWFDYSEQNHSEELADLVAQVFLKGFLYPPTQKTTPACRNLSQKRRPRIALRRAGTGSARG